MKLVLFVLVGCCGILVGCQDKKKTDQLKEDSVKEKQRDSSVLTNSEINQKVQEKSTFPKITNENAVAFFTEYGSQNPETKVRITAFNGTVKDSIDIQLYKDTPLHRANFIFLVKQGYFNSTFFHRVAPNFIIQGGDSDNVNTAKQRTEIGNKYLLPAELTNNRKHTYGSISGAKEYRENPDNRTAPFEFFIFLGPDSNGIHLNGTYTIFGKVTRNMKFVETIANLPADDGEWPLENVYIQAKVID